MKALSRLIILGITVCTLAHCGNNRDSSNRFPSFTQVGKESKTARLYVDLSSVRKENEMVIFKMIRALDNGYAMQDAFTDCRETFQCLDGIQYKDDGTSAGKYAGDQAPVSLKQSPELNALATLVCDKAKENRVIVGSFNDARALELLYGKYYPESKAALWKKVRTGNKENPLEGQDAVVSTVFSKEYAVNGIAKHILITKSVPKDEPFECHACAPLIGGAVFSQKDGKWHVEEEHLYLGILGKYGEPDEMKWEKIGDNKYALVVNSGDIHQGEEYSSTRIYLLTNTGLKSIFGVIGTNDTNREGGEEGEWVEKLTFEKGTNPDYYDLKCLRTVARNKGQAQGLKQTVIYKFVNGKYVESIK